MKNCCFHIFYQLLTGLSDDKLKEYRLSKYFSNYNYLNQSNCFERTDNIKDSLQFNEMEKSMNIIGFNDNEINNIYFLKRR